MLFGKIVPNGKIVPFKITVVSFIYVPSWITVPLGKLHPVFIIVPSGNLVPINFTEGLGTGIIIGILLNIILSDWYGYNFTINLFLLLVCL